MGDEPHLELTAESVAAFLLCVARVLHKAGLATREAGQLSEFLRDGLDYTIDQAVSGSALSHLAPVERGRDSHLPGYSRLVQ